MLWTKPYGWFKILENQDKTRSVLAFRASKLRFGMAKKGLLAQAFAIYQQRRKGTAKYQRRIRGR